MHVYKVELEFITPCLGTAPKDEETYATYIASLASAQGRTDEEVEEELQSVEDLEERGWTGFRVDPETGRCSLIDYMYKGYLKSAFYGLRKVDKDANGNKPKAAGIRAYKKVVTTQVFVYPRFTPLVVPEDIDPEKLPVKERSLRAQTPQGERTTLVRSDMAPAGTTVSFWLEVLGGGMTPEIVEELFWFGTRKGLGQWRSGGFGRFLTTLEQVDALPERFSDVAPPPPWSK